MKLGFICMNVPGHLNPNATLARHLQARNHEVVFIHSSPPGLPSIAPEKDHFSKVRPDVSTMRGEEAVETSIRALMDRTESILKSLPVIVRTHGLQALIIDDVQFYAQLGAIQLGLPYIGVSTGLHLDYSGCTPLCLYDWPHQTNPEALERNRAGVAAFTKVLNSHNGGIKAYAKSVGLDIDWEDLGSMASPWASISQTPKAFDFDSSHWPSRFHHTGPFLDSKLRAKVDFPWERITGEPLIYASMGTILNGRPEVFRTIVAAAAKLRGLQLVLSVGDQLDPKEVGPAPSNAIIVQYAPQLELLSHASVCVTHAGLNTVLESLAQAVPQVAIPVTYDQPGIAARITEKRTGAVASLDKLTADHLAGLLVDVLANPVYRDNACKMREAIAEADGLSSAADVIERSLEGTARV